MMNTIKDLVIKENNTLILWNEVEQDVRESYKKINSPFPSGIVFPHHKSLLLNGFINEIVG